MLGSQLRESKMRKIADGVGCAQQHLEADVGDGFAQVAQAREGIFVQKAHGDVEGGAAPHLQAVEIVQFVRDEVGDAQHVVGAHAGGQQGLVSVAEGGVGEQEFLLPGGPGGEAFGAQVAEQLAGAVRSLGGVVRRQGPGASASGGGLTGHLRIAVDDDVGEVAQQFGGAVLARREFEQRGGFLEPSGAHVASLEIGVVDDVFEERDVGLDTAHAELAEAAVHALAGVRELASPGGGLDQQGIVERRDDGAGVGGAAVQADAESGGGAVGVDLAVVGDEAVGGVLGGDAALQGVAIERHAVLRRQVHFGAVQGEPLGDLNLAAHQVDAGDHLGHRVLHLYARVDFDEVPLAGIGVHKELHRAGIGVAGGAGQSDGGIGQLGADLGRQRHGGRHLDHLLMAPLHGAIALVEVQDVAVPVAQNLDFDVFGAAHVAFQEYGVVAEGGGRFLTRLFQFAGEVLGFVHHAHAASAAAERGFDDQRVADLASDLGSVSFVGDGFPAARDARNSGLLGEAAGGGFVAQQGKKIGRRPDKGDAGALAGAGQGGVLGEKTVARVDGVDALLFGQRDDAFHVEVSLHRSFALADEVGFVGLEAV